MRRLAPVMVLVVAACGGTEASGTLMTPMDTVVFTNFTANPVPQTITLSSTRGTASWTLTDDMPWLTVQPTAGASMPATFTVTAAADFLRGGPHEALVHVLAPGHTELLLPVRLEVPSMSGHWTGLFVSGGVTLTLDMNLAESAAGVVSGSGTLSGGSPLNVAIGGTQSHPNVVLNITAAGFQPATIEASFVSPTSISGSITGSGFNGEYVGLTRH